MSLQDIPQAKGAAHISIEWIHGRPHNNPEDDEERAIAAAEAVLNAAGAPYIDAYEAYEAYRQQWDEFDDEGPMTGNAVLWVEARAAANAALTEGWHNPNGAACSISAWRSTPTLKKPA